MKKFICPKCRKFLNAEEIIYNDCEGLFYSDGFPRCPEDGYVVCMAEDNIYYMQEVKDKVIREVIEMSLDAREICIL